MEVAGVRKITQVYVFDGDEYLGWDCFEKGVIHLGTDPAGDVLLDDSTLQPLHARIRPNGTGAVLERLGPEGFLVETRRIGPLDALTFGRFTVKVRVKAPRSAEPAGTPEGAPPPVLPPGATPAPEPELPVLEPLDPLEPLDVEPLDLEPLDLEPLVPGAPEEPPAPEPSAPSEPLPAEPLAAEPRRVEAAEPRPPIPEAHGRVLEVIRVRAGRVVEVRHLGPGDEYRASGHVGPTPVAESREGFWFYADGLRRRASVLAKNGRLVPFAGNASEEIGRAHV